MRRINFGAQLMAGFLLILLLATASSGFAIWQVVRSSDEREQATHRIHEGVIYAERFRAAEAAASAASQGYLFTRNSVFLHRLNEAQQQADQALFELKRRVQSTEGQRLLDEMEAASAGLARSQERRRLEVALEVDADEVRSRLEQENLALRAQMEKSVDAFIAHKEASLELGYREAEQLVRRGIQLSVLAELAAFILAALIAWSLSRYLSNAYERERRAVGARDELLGIVAHDLRSPLSAIAIKAALVKAALARRGMDDEQPVRQAAAIENIAMRMEYLIRSLLDAASAEAGRLNVLKAPCAVEPVIQEAGDMFESIAAAAGVQLETHLEPLEQWVHADRERLLEVLVNLLANAIKFSPKGTRVELRAEQIDDEVRFSVSDEGPGISSEHLPHLFERFWKADHARLGGTGLGLYIARKIVDAHGGRIWVDSKAGQGSTFYFALPRIQTPRSALEVPPEAAPGSQA